MAHDGDLLDHHGRLERNVPSPSVEVGVVRRTHTARGGSWSPPTPMKGCRVRYIERRFIRRFIRRSKVTHSKKLRIQANKGASRAVQKNVRDSCPARPPTAFLSACRPALTYAVAPYTCPVDCLLRPAPGVCRSLRERSNRAAQIKVSCFMARSGTWLVHDAKAVEVESRCGLT